MTLVALGQAPSRPQRIAGGGEMSAERSTSSQSDQPVRCSCIMHLR